MSNPENDEMKQDEEAGVELGKTLRQAREAKSLSLEAVASELNLRLAVLEQLEEESFDGLPGPTFVRGYIRAYANLLDLDGAALAKLYVVGDGRHESLKPLLNVGRKPKNRFFLVSLLLLVAVLLGLAAYWWVEQKQSQPMAEVSSQPQQLALEQENAITYIQSLDELDAQTAGMALEEIELPETPAAVLDDLTEADIAAGEATEQNDAGELADLLQEDQLELSFIQDSWIRVTDAQGNELASGLKRAGETLSIVGHAPFEVHLGYARGVIITFNAQNIDFDSKIRGNVARLKLG